jgi:exodeoxyribonuclease V gamma subunit
MWQLYRMVLGRDEIPATSLLDKAPLTWRLMRLLPELIDQPHFEPLQRFLTHDTDLRKRYQLAERLADLFDQYQVYRADWLEDWADGRPSSGVRCSSMSVKRAWRRAGPAFTSVISSGSTPSR